MADPRELFSDLVRFETELWDAVDERLRTGVGLPLNWFEPMLVIDQLARCRVLDIAEALSITVGGTSKLVDRMESAGLCQRQPNPEDRRSSLITLTAAGQRRLAAATAHFDAELARQFAAVSASTLDRFHSVLQRLRTASRTVDQPTDQEATHA